MLQGNRDDNVLRFSQLRPATSTDSTQTGSAVARDEETPAPDAPHPPPARSESSGRRGFFRRAPASAVRHGGAAEAETLEPAGGSDTAHTSDSVLEQPGSESAAGSTMDINPTARRRLLGLADVTDAYHEIVATIDDARINLPGATFDKKRSVLSISREAEIRSSSTTRRVLAVLKLRLADHPAPDVIAQLERAVETLSSTPRSPGDRRRNRHRRRWRSPSSDRSASPTCS